MTNRDEELENLASQRRRLREQRESLKTSMEVAYRQISQLKDKKPDLKRQANNEYENAKYHWQKSDEAGNVGDQTTATEYWEYGMALSKKSNEIFAEVKKLDAEISSLWDEHNQAATELRAVNEQYRKVNASYEARLNEVRDRESQRQPQRKHSDRNAGNERSGRPEIITLVCTCTSPRRIRVRQSDLEVGPLLCGNCGRQFKPI